MVSFNAVAVGDTIWIEFSGWDARGPFATIRGGEVVAVGDGSIAFRDHSGGIETIRNWGIHTIHETNADAWAAAGDRLARIASEVTSKIAECRRHAAGQKVVS